MTEILWKKAGKLSATSPMREVLILIELNMMQRIDNCHVLSSLFYSFFCIFGSFLLFYLNSNQCVDGVHGKAQIMCLII